MTLTIHSDHPSARPSVTHDAGHSLQRHTWRALVGSCVPIVLAVYFGLTWMLYLRQPVSPFGFYFGGTGSRTVFYSWFILGVIGLDLSEYGLLGVEASLLMTTFWAAPDAWHVILHGDHSWSGLEGWWQALRSHFREATAKPRHLRDKRAPGRLWWLLATPSILLFAALPLAGLSMELKQGFRKSGRHPQMTGRTWDNFNDRPWQSTLLSAHRAWSLAALPRVPAFGMVFANHTIKQDDPIAKYFQTRDNTVPADNATLDVNDFFLGPQAAYPFTGKAWGLVVRYHCTVIQNLNDFIILSRRDGSKPLGASYNVDDYTIEVKNHTTGHSGGRNYKAIAELGYSRDSVGTRANNSHHSTQCYFNGTKGATRGYPGLTHDNVLELAIWQTATTDNWLASNMDPVVYNFTLDLPIKDLRGAHKVSLDHGESMADMEAIGVQCNSSSAVGTADVDGVTSQYHNFVPSDTKIQENGYCARRLESAVPWLIFAGDTMRDSWSEDFFASAEARRLLLRPVSEDDARETPVRSTLLQAAQLRRALARAYGITAVQLMYDGAQGYKLGHFATYENKNVTGYYREQVLVPGDVPPALPAILFFLWALISCILSVKYGFLRRWADTLDSFSMFQFGGDLSTHFRVKEMPAYSFKDLRDHEQLARLPGLVGDLQPSFNPGHITLVHRNHGSSQARRTKKYV